MRSTRYSIFFLWVLVLPLLVTVAPEYAVGDQEPLPAINNPNPGSDLWEAVRGRLDSPATTQVEGFDSAVLVNQQGELWTTIRNTKYQKSSTRKTKFQSKHLKQACQT